MHSPVVIEKETFELAADDSWGWSSGVKQPLGALRGGLSLHQVTRYDPVGGGTFSGDNICWVDEARSTCGIARQPTGQVPDSGHGSNPGGMVAFTTDGHIWYTIGGRAHQLAPDLFRSLAPYDPSTFVKKLDDYETGTGSTPWNLHIHAQKALMCWRRTWAKSADGQIWFRRYDLGAEMPTLEFEQAVARAVEHPTLQVVGFEQTWMRFDPRHRLLLLSWHWFGGAGVQMGSLPFLCSDDDGATWHRADGSVVAGGDLPFDYSAADRVLVPYDHLARGEHIGWFLQDLGVAPGGTSWMTMPVGSPAADGGPLAPAAVALVFFRFDRSHWQSTPLATVERTMRSHACGVTKDYLVSVFADSEQPNLLKCRLSRDDGRTWTEPAVVDQLDTSRVITWVSFVQPSAAYEDNAARFFYSHCSGRDGPEGRRYKNSIKWIRLVAGEAPSGAG